MQPGTIVFYADIACPWSHVAAHRLWTTRARLGLENDVAFEPRAFPLELFNDRPTPKTTLDAEMPVAGGLAPGAGWKMWRRPLHEYPGTTLPALEAVQAAAMQSRRAAEQLDDALRRGFFADNRMVHLRHEILDIAESCAEVEAAALATALDSGSARATVMRHKVEGESDEVRGSPHLFLADGSDFHNPGIRMRWEGGSGGFPVIEHDDPAIYEDILGRAAGSAPGPRRVQWTKAQ